MNQPFYVRDAKAIDALAWPLRQALIDSIVARGPATVADLAMHVNRPPDRLYYHIRVLLRAGLLLERPREGDREATYDVPGRPMVLDYGAFLPSQRRAVSRVVSALLRTAQREFRSAASDEDVRASGPSRELWSGRVEGSLTPGELKEVNAHLAAALRVLAQSRNGRRRSTAKDFQITWALTPLSRARRRS